MEKPKSTVQKFTFTIIDLLILFGLVVALYFGYYKFTEKKENVTPETVYITTAVMKKEMKFEEFIGKISKSDSLFDTSGNSIGKVDALEYRDEENSRFLYITCTFTGQCFENEKFFVNTTSFCGDFDVCEIVKVTESEKYE